MRGEESASGASRLARHLRKPAGPRGSATWTRGTCLASRSIVNGNPAAGGGARAARGALSGTRQQRTSVTVAPGGQTPGRVCSMYSCRAHWIGRRVPASLIIQGLLNMGTRLEYQSKWCGGRCIRTLLLGLRQEPPPHGGLLRAPPGRLGNGRQKRYRKKVPDTI